MSSRSDVGIAIKKELLISLSPSIHGFLSEVAEEKHEREEGMLFVCRDVSWSQMNPAIKELYKELVNCEPSVSTGVTDDGGYRIVEACFDYPDSDENDQGGWLDNPWKLGKYVSVSLAFDDGPVPEYQPEVKT